MTIKEAIIVAIVAGATFAGMVYAGVSYIGPPFPASIGG
jgi:hypothetical protein